MARLTELVDARIAEMLGESRSAEDVIAEAQSIVDAMDPETIRARVAAPPLVPKSDTERAAAERRRRVEARKRQIKQEARST